LQAFPAAHDDDSDTMEYTLHMMDFSPLAIKRRQGLGRVVEDPSAIKLLSEKLVTTSLPYVEVVSNRKLRADDLASIQFDQDRIYLDRYDVSSFRFLTKSD